jgi:hypothetical protein
MKKYQSPTNGIFGMKKYHWANPGIAHQVKVDFRRLQK